MRETRVTSILSHALIGLSILIMFVLAYIPTPVLYGLFLYVAITALYDNQMFERITLFFMEQVSAWELVGEVYYLVECVIITHENKITNKQNIKQVPAPLINTAIIVVFVKGAGTCFALFVCLFVVLFLFLLF